MFARNRFAPQAHALRLPVVLVRNVLYPGDVRRKLARLQEAGHQRDRETLRSVDARALRRQLPRFHAKSLAIPDVADLHTQLPNVTAPP